MVTITIIKRQYSLKANVALAPEPSPVNIVSTSARYGGRTVFSTWAGVTEDLVLTLSLGLESSDFVLGEIVGELLISPSNLVECITDSSENIKAATINSVLIDHSKIDKPKVLKTNGSLSKWLISEDWAQAGQIPILSEFTKKTMQFRVPFSRKCHLF